MTIYADRVKETTTTTGTGTYDLAGAATGYQGFVAGIATGNTCQYCVTDGTDWEVGIGTVTDAAPDTLSRDTILASSNGDAAVNWGAGSKDVFLVQAASAIAFIKDTNDQITVSSGITLDQATGNEIALDLSYTVNKATSGNDTGLRIAMTDTASPGTSLLLNATVGGGSVFSVDNTGAVTFANAYTFPTADGAGANYVLVTDGAGTVTWAAQSGSGAFVADGNSLITPSSAITLNQATGNEVALTVNYTVNKATSGNDTGLLVSMTDTASPGTSLPLDVQVGGSSVAWIDNSGNALINGTIYGSEASGGGLTLSSTNHATKGSVTIGAASEVVIDESTVSEEPTLLIDNQVTSGGFGEPLRCTIQGDSETYFRIYSNTSNVAHFIPTFAGYTSNTNVTIPLSFHGQFDSADDDSATKFGCEFQARRHTGAAAPGVLQTNSLFRFRNYATQVGAVDVNGQWHFGATVPGSYTAMVSTLCRSATTIGAIIEAAGSQTANLLEVNSNGGSGGNLAVIDSAGNLGLGVDPTYVIDSEAATGTSWRIKCTGNGSTQLIMDANRSAADGQIGGIVGYWNSSQVASILILSGDDATNKDEGYIRFSVSQGAVLSETARFEQDGEIWWGSGIQSYLRFHSADPGAWTALADTDGQDVWFRTEGGGAHSVNNPNGGDFNFLLGLTGGGTGIDGRLRVLNNAGTEQFRVESDGDIAMLGNITGSGGTTISGGTAASNNLTLDSTTDATKGSIICSSNILGDVGTGITISGGDAASDDLILQSTTNATKGEIRLVDGTQIEAGLYYASETQNNPTGTTATIDWTASNFQELDVSGASGDVTVSFTAPSGPCSLRLRITQGGTARDLTWPTGTWLGTEPTWNADTSLTRIMAIDYDGTNYWYAVSEAG